MTCPNLQIECVNKDFYNMSFALENSYPVLRIWKIEESKKELPSLEYKKISKWDREREKYSKCGN